MGIKTSRHTQILANPTLLSISGLTVMLILAGAVRWYNLHDPGLLISREQVYSEENNRWVQSLISPLRQHVTSRMPRKVLLGISQLLAGLLFLLLRGVFLPANSQPLGVQLQRLLPYNDYLVYTSRLSFPELTCVVFDHLVPQLTWYISRAEIEKWFQNGNLTEVLISPRNSMSWRGAGFAPGPANPH